LALALALATDPEWNVPSDVVDQVASALADWEQDLLVGVSYSYTSARTAAVVSNAEDPRVPEDMDATLTKLIDKCFSSATVVEDEKGSGAEEASASSSSMEDDDADDQEHDDPEDAAARHLRAEATAFLHKLCGLLKHNLRRHQWENIAFAWLRENGPCIRNPTSSSSGSGSGSNAEGPDGRGGVVADSPGLGKTVSILSLVAASDSFPTLIVVTNEDVLTQWQDDAYEFFKEGVFTLVKCIHARDGYDIHRLSSTRKAVITTYSTLRSAAAEPKAPSRGKPPKAQSKHARTKDPRAHLFDIPWKRIVADEAQKIKTANSDIGGVFSSRLHAPCKWLMTATPVSNEVSEIVQLFRVLGCPPIKTPEDLRLHVRQRLIRHTNENVDIQFPTLTVEVLSLVLDDTISHLHDLLDRAILSKKSGRSGAKKSGGGSDADPGGGARGMTLNDMQLYEQSAIDPVGTLFPKWADRPARGRC
jgi:thiamine phosphate synthase YjbQ (UPF0047 family)